ncbi:MAG: hypothetical protein WCH78_05860 [Bacteroidota bacterium]
MRRCFVTIFLFGCSFNNQADSFKQKSVQGTFRPYQSALGSGRGILFKINITDLRKTNFKIDSFYLNGHTVPFNVIESGNASYLECDYYKSVRPIGYSPNQQKSNENSVNEIYDSIIMFHKFYPSWILIASKLRRQRLEVESFQEIIPDSKY